MLPILQDKTVLTMSSRDIAAITGKLHKNVTPVILSLQADGLLTADIQPSTFEHRGNTYTEYNLCKRDSILLVARLSPEFTAALVDRWQELESSNQQAIPNFNDPVAAARAWADAKESEIKAIQYAEAAKPAVAFVERYVQSTGNLGFRQVCKLLKAKENDFRAFLQDSRIMYKLAGDWVPYASHIDAGRFYVTTGTGDNDRNFTSAKFTPKGVEWVAKLWGEK
jgi:phage antirepressor YoqD-like protein